MLCFLIFLTSSRFLYFDSLGQGGWQESKAQNYTGKWLYNSTSKFLTTTSKERHHAISHAFDTPIDNTNKTLIVQFEVSSPEIIDCSGAYIKLFGPKKVDPFMVTGETNYIIMFGPDKCYSKRLVQFIFNHYNPKTKLFEEKKLIMPPEFPIDNNTHVYTLIIRPDNTFSIKIDTNVVRQGNLLDDFNPPVNEFEIDDPSDIKPNNWVEDEYIVDEAVQKPDDWDDSQPEFIPDPKKAKPPKGWLENEPKEIFDKNAKKPSNWDDALLGEWEPPLIPNPTCEKATGCGKYEPPLIPNPEYVGKWEPPMHRNPHYRGPWVPRKILNPNYYEDLHPHNFGNITGVGFELWVVDPGVGFRNVIIDHSIINVNKWTHLAYPKIGIKNSVREVEKEESIPISPLDYKKLGIKVPIYEQIIAHWMYAFGESWFIALLVFIMILLLPIIIFRCFGC